MKSIALGKENYGLPDDMAYDEKFLEDKIIGTTANCRKRRSIDLRFLRYEGLTAVA